MNQYIYFILGIVLGISIAVYFYEEKIEKTIEYNQRIYSTKKLDVTMQTVVERITSSINELKRDLTEEEKNEIIVKCYKEKFLEL